MKRIRYTDTLVYSDGTQVFEGRDLTGGCYVGVLIDSLDNADRYVVAGVSAERMTGFRSGALDLRTLLLEGSEDAWYLTQTSNDFADPLALEEQSGAIADTDFLPEDGFVNGVSTEGEACSPLTVN